MNSCFQMHATSRRRQTGVGLLEVMIAVLVLSIGFLGIAALQVHALSTNNSAMARSMATIASYSILDAMRTDRAAAESGNYNTIVTADECPDAGGSLSSAQLHSWCEQLSDTLGASANTTGKIDCTNTGHCTITIKFDDGRVARDDNVTSQVEIVTRAAL